MAPLEASDIKSAAEILSNGSYDFVILDETMSEGNDQMHFTAMKGEGNARAFFIMISPVGRRLRRDMIADGWLTKPIKPLELRSLMIGLLMPGKSVKPDAKIGLAAMDESAMSISNKPDKSAGNSNDRCEDRCKTSILLAEDNPVNQKVATIMLRRLGYRADVAANGLEVLQALETKHYDMVFMDVQMPEMDGLETTRRIRSSGIDSLIIAMTAHALEGDREKCLSAGMDEYISKPIKMEELQKVLEKFDDA